MFWGRHRVFICYRRDDASADARNLREGLARVLGKSAIFMDVDNLFAGENFEEQLHKALSRCDVLLAVVGPRWLRRLSEHQRRGERDYVRDEIAEALRRRIRVIPVLVGREGRMPELPEKEELPADIQEFVLHHKARLMHETADRDIAKLVSDVDPAFWWRRATVRVGAGAIAATLVIGYLWEHLGSGRSASASPPIDSTSLTPPPASRAPQVAPPVDGASPAPRPDLDNLQTKSASARVSPYVAQLFAQRTHAEAETARSRAELRYAALQSRYPETFRTRNIAITRADLGPDGVWYRGWIGPFTDEEEARQFCNRLKSNDVPCWHRPAD